MGFGEEYVTNTSYKSSNVQTKLGAVLCIIWLFNILPSDERTDLNVEDIQILFFSKSM